MAKSPIDDISHTWTCRHFSAFYSSHGLHNLNCVNISTYRLNANSKVDRQLRFLVKFEFSWYPNESLIAAVSLRNVTICFAIIGA